MLSAEGGIAAVVIGLLVGIGWRAWRRRHTDARPVSPEDDVAEERRRMRALAAADYHQQTRRDGKD